MLSAQPGGPCNVVEPQLKRLLIFATVKAASEHHEVVARIRNERVTEALARQRALNSELFRDYAQQISGLFLFILPLGVFKVNSPEVVEDSLGSCCLGDASI